MLKKKLKDFGMFLFKNPILILVLGSASFLGLFLYVFIRSRKFRHSFIAAFTVLSVYFSFLEPVNGIDQADAW